MDKSLIVHLGNKIDGNGAKALCETLKMNTTLKNLMMTSTLIHFDNIINIVYILFFSGNEIGEIGAQLFSDVLRTNTSLIKLDLTCNEIIT